MPASPLPVPNLAVLGVPPDLVFTWSWPSPPGIPTYNVSLEHSRDGITWKRVSPPISETITTYSYSQSAGSWQYRLRVMSPDGRVAYSNTVRQE